MRSLQPRNKSFGFYVKYGYSVYNNKITTNQNMLFNKLSIIDDSVLIMDDIFDNSSTRNGKPCLHRIYGVQHATMTSQKYEKMAYDYLIKLMDLSNTKKSFRSRILKEFRKFIEQINIGQRIDSELSKISTFSPKLISKYFTMIKMFTGGHVKYGILIGQLLASKEPNKQIIKDAESVGVIRQIRDDFDDYFEMHHEPFGDFKNGANRLPELLFKKNDGNREKILLLLEKKRYFKAREVVLSNVVREGLYHYCRIEHNKIKSVVKELVDDYELILNKY